MIRNLILAAPLLMLPTLASAQTAATDPTADFLLQQIVTYQTETVQVAREILAELHVLSAQLAAQAPSSATTATAIAKAAQAADAAKNLTVPAAQTPGSFPAPYTVAGTGSNPP